MQIVGPKEEVSCKIVLSDQIFLGFLHSIGLSFDYQEICLAIKAPNDAVIQIFKEIIGDAGFGYCRGQCCKLISASRLRRFTAGSMLTARHKFSF